MLLLLQANSVNVFQFTISINFNLKIHLESIIIHNIIASIKYRRVSKEKTSSFQTSLSKEEYSDIV